ncbi:MAG: hypothetical protein Ct9H300mP27_08910 [Chloroflexota bacterium]|nr:MAG: hypothetical protein Ct9H300mP27_08910 [Chloroflexota bacterium]
MKFLVKTKISLWAILASMMVFALACGGAAAPAAAPNSTELRLQSFRIST